MKGFRLLLITFVVAVIPVPVRAGLIFNRHSKANATPAQREILDRFARYDRTAGLNAGINARQFGVAPGAQPGDHSRR